MTDPTSVPLAGAKVLLVDDQRDNLDVLVGILAPDGYDIRVALTGDVAVALAQRFHPDLVVLDVLMPGLDGFAVCRQLRAVPETADIPVIFLTAGGEAVDALAAFKAGGVDYITKPVRDQELRARVSTHLRLRLLYREVVEKNHALEREIAERRAVSAERDRLAGRITAISDEELRRWDVAGFVGQSRTLKKILGEIDRLRQAGSTTSVLITGESGTGKELVARALHFGSPRADRPFVPVNCSAVPAELADSLFFGHVKGTFTGADSDRLGYFALADGGTLFLDEIGDMPPDLQAKLLRVLEQRAVMPVGGDQEQPFDVRVVAATHVDLAAAVQEGRFRQDLYYRLAGFPVHVPPLRDRREDIDPLARHFVELFATEMGVAPPPIAPAALAALQAHPFPGNVRELKNAIERALIESGGGPVEPPHLHLRRDEAPVAADTPGPDVGDLPLNLAEAELALIHRAMGQTGGNIARAARLLGVNRMRIYRRLAAEGEEP